MAASINMVRSSSPKAVISESSPIKKRRVDGFCNVDYKHRRGSRSGDLALLRVLSAPTSPLSPPSFSSPSKTNTSPSSRYRPRSEQRIFLLQRPSSPVKNRSAATSPKTIELRKDHFVFQKPALPVKQESRAQPSTVAKEPILEAVTESKSSALMASTSDVMQRAEQIAGAVAVHHKQLIPICDEDVILNFFNPETSSKDQAAAKESDASQLPSVISPDASLKEKIEALQPGRSLLLVYSTRDGAEMFVNNMLTPVLDPLLRRTVNTHGLPDETARRIRSTCKECVDNMLSYEDLRETVEHVVAAANGEAGPSNGGGAAFEQKMAERAVVRIPGAAWKKAWAEQEGDAVRDLVELGLQGRGGGEKIDYSGIMHPKAGRRVAEELLDDIKRHNFERWENKQESDEVEVGVFVIHRR